MLGEQPANAVLRGIIAVRKERREAEAPHVVRIERLKEEAKEKEEPRRTKMMGEQSQRGRRKAKARVDSPRASPSTTMPIFQKKP